jgi:hypothetical protein
MTMRKDRQQQQQQQRVVLPPRCLLLLLILVATCATCHSFTTTGSALPTLKGTRCAQYKSNTKAQSSAMLFLSDPENQNENDNNDDNNIKNDGGILSRFISPVIDDPALPLSDVLVAQIIAPSIQVVWLSLNHAPTPGWLRPIFDTNAQLFAARGSLVAPALIHGAALASCWIVGALAAKTYERAAIAPTEDNPSGYETVLWRVVQAGAFATGVLIMSTQADLLLEYKGQWVQPGESPEIDLRLLTATVEVLNDVFFEAVCLVSWRLFLARQTATGSNFK